MTPSTEIRKWLLIARRNGATHVLTVCDEVEGAAFPVVINKGASVAEAVERYRALDLHRPLELYNLALDIDRQLDEGRSWHLSAAEPQWETAGEPATVYPVHIACDAGGTTRITLELPHSVVDLSDMPPGWSLTAHLESFELKR